MKLRLLSTCMSVVLSCCLSTCPTFAQDLSTKLQLVIKQAGNNGFSGQVVVGWNGKVVLNSAVGLADPTNQRQNSADSLFYVGSVAKIITSATALQLTEEGVLNLDAPIHQYLPTERKDKRAITVRHLLSHQSGLPANHDDPLKMLSRDDFVTWALGQKLSFKPGARWAYSNVGYSLLAAIIEHATKRPFQEVIRERVLSKANMTSTYFLDELNDKNRGLLTIGKGPMCDEFKLSGRIDDFEPTWLRYGPGAIVSSASDMAKLCQAIGDGRVYSKKSLKLATTEVRNGWGVGWRLSLTRKRTPLHYHDGGFAGFHAVLARMPSENGYLVVTSNKEKAAEPLVKALFDVLIKQSN